MLILNFERSRVRVPSMWRMCSCRMGLVVVDPDEKASAGSVSSWPTSIWSPCPAVNVKIAQEICDHALPELMVCSRMDWAQQLCQRQPSAFPWCLAPSRSRWKREPRCWMPFAGGLADVWQLPAGRRVPQGPDRRDPRADPRRVRPRPKCQAARACGRAAAGSASRALHSDGHAARRTPWGSTATASSTASFRL